MKSLKCKLQSIIAKITYNIAEKGAGLASFLGMYQPKLPERLQR